MSIRVKRFIFWSLVTMFLGDSAVVYLSGCNDLGPANQPTEKANSGKLLFQEHNCIACHQIYGLGGYMGPDLTNVISDRARGEAYARSFIQMGTTRMPDFHLTGTEVDDLVAYLKYVDKTGNSPVRNFSIQYDGTIRTVSKE
jgi:nitric oxide reductase subunit C